MPPWRTVLLKRVCSVGSLGWFSYIAGWGLHFLDSFSCGLGSAFSGCWSCWIRIHPNHLIRTWSHWQRPTFRVRSSHTGPQLCPPCAPKCPNPENDQGSLPVGTEKLAHVLILTTPHALIFLAPRGPHLWPWGALKCSYPGPIYGSLPAGWEELVHVPFVSYHTSCPVVSSTSGPFPRCMGKRGKQRRTVTKHLSSTR